MFLKGQYSKLYLVPNKVKAYLFEIFKTWLKIDFLINWLWTRASFK